MTTILITGATDGLGHATARHLADLGHRLVLHGRNTDKLAQVRDGIESAQPGSVTRTVVADLADLAAVDRLADEGADADLEVVINNAGVYRVDDPITPDGLDVRFVVNTLAPYRLTRRLAPSLPAAGRVVNLSSAAQAPVDLAALRGERRLDAGEAYAQSKLALTMWSAHLGGEIGADGPAIIAVNPGSLLATPMVNKAFGITGNDLGIGVDVLTRAATSAEFADATSRYYDNDADRFAPPHPDGQDPDTNATLVTALDALLP